MAESSTHLENTSRKQVFVNKFCTYSETKCLNISRSVFRNARSISNEVINLQVDGFTECSLVLSAKGVLATDSRTFVLRFVGFDDPAAWLYLEKVEIVVFIKDSQGKKSDAHCQTMRILKATDNREVEIPVSHAHDWDKLRTDDVLVLQIDYSIQFCHAKAHNVSLGVQILHDFETSALRRSVQNLSTIIQTGQLEKVEIFCGPDAEPILLNKQLLIMHSSFFVDYFAGEREKAASIKIQLPETKAVISFLVNYMMEGKLDSSWKKMEVLEPLVMACQRYKFHDLITFFDGVLGFRDVIEPSVQLLRICDIASLEKAKGNLFPVLKSEFVGLRTWKNLKRLLGSESFFELRDPSQYVDLESFMNDAAFVVKNSLTHIQAANLRGKSQLERTLCKRYVHSLHSSKTIAGFLSHFCFKN